MRHTNMLSRVLSLVLAALMLLGSVGVVPASAAEGWTVSADTEIFWAETTASENDYETLAAQVRRFAADLAEKVTGTELPVSYGYIEKAGANDIILLLDTSLAVLEQGYAIVENEGQIIVEASDAAGLLYGCNVLIKQLMTGGAYDDASEPYILERALQVDIGRKYFEVDWIKGMIRELAWNNMNALVLHFSEEMGLGLESTTYPWLNGRDGVLCTQAEVADDEHVITQAEMAEIIAYAKQYHVEVIPSFDSPGHMNYIVKKFNEKSAVEEFTFTYKNKTYTVPKGTDIGNYFHYNGKTSIVKGSRNASYSRGIDISNEIAVAFTKSLVEEYARFFRGQGCTKFDIGGDELLGWGSAIVSTTTKWQQLDHWKEYAQNRAKAEGLTNYADAVAYDGFMYYMNDMYDLVSDLGYTSVRMWNDDAYRTSDTGWKKVVELNADMDILFWTTGTSIWAYGEHDMYNYLGDYNYCALTTDWYSDSRSSFTKAYADDIYNEWNPYVFTPDTENVYQMKQVGNGTVKGSAFLVWCDYPTLRTEAQIREDILPLVKSHAAKAWDALIHETVDYTSFAASMAAVGDAPSDNEGGAIYIVADLSELEAAVAAADSVDGSPYTADSYAAYVSAVNAGKALLNADKPAQDDVDAAVDAIAAAYAELTEKPPVDTTALQEAIAEYEAEDPSAYTAESFAQYTAAVDAGKALLASGVYTQEEVDAAVEKIEEMASLLWSAENSGGTTAFISGSFKSATVAVGKVATLNMSVVKDLDIVEFAIYNDLNETTEIFRMQKSTKKSDRDNWVVMFKPTAAEVGERTYTVYAVFSDGSLSADCLTLDLKIK